MSSNMHCLLHERTTSKLRISLRNNFARLKVFFKKLWLDRFFGMERITRYNEKESI